MASQRPPLDPSKYRTGRGADLMAKLAKAQEMERNPGPPEDDPLVQHYGTEAERKVETREQLIERMRKRRQAMMKAKAEEENALSAATGTSSSSSSGSPTDPSSLSPRPTPADFEAHSAAHSRFQRGILSEVSQPVAVETTRTTKMTTTGADTSGYGSRSGSGSGGGASSGGGVASGQGSSNSPASSSSGSGGARRREIEFVEGSLEKMRLTEPNVNKGTAGTPIELEANYIGIKVCEGAGFFEYEVRFEPDLDARNARFACIGKLGDLLGKARTFDGTKLCMPYKLEKDVTIAESEYLPEFPRVMVRISFQSERSFSDQNAIQMYNILFRRIMQELKFVEWNRNHYNPAKASFLHALKLEIWPGYVTAISLREGGLFLVCDISSRVLRNETAVDVVADIHSNCRNNSNQMAEIHIKKALLGQSVLTRYNNKHYRIDDVDFNSSPADCFTNSRGEKVRYVDYYQKQYQITIKDHKQCLLLSRPKKRNPQDADRLICLVPELCYLTGISEDTRKDHGKMREIYSHISCSPGQRSLSVKKFLASVRDSPRCCEILAEWGLEMDSAAIHLQGRILNSVKLVYGDRSNPRSMAVNTNYKLDDGIMLQACPMESWLLVVDERNRRAADDFLTMFYQVSTKLGMMVAKPILEVLRTDRTEEYIRAIRNNMRAKPCLVFVIVPSKREDKYAAIKKLCHLELGVPAQVMLTKHMGSPKFRSVVCNIGRQVNAKLGGEVYGCRSPYTNAMCVGVDVYHNQDKRSSSWVGLVASLNTYFTRWTSHTREQLPHVEMVNSMQEMFIDALQQYRTINHILPDRIIIYRDGVGDGRLEFTREFEVAQMRSAFRAFEDYDPPLTMIIVSKRINTKMLLVNPRDNPRQTEPMINPRPGSVLDHTVTKRDWFDFFLVSQDVRQGTVSPTHYIVIDDGIKMGADKVQKFTYMLTYMYVNWAGPVRVPAPCLYAHRIAGQTGEYLHQAPKAMNPTQLFYI